MAPQSAYGSADTYAACTAERFTFEDKPGSHNQSSPVAGASHAHVQLAALKFQSLCGLDLDAAPASVWVKAENVIARSLVGNCPVRVRVGSGLRTLRWPSLRFMDGSTHAPATRLTGGLGDRFMVTAAQAWPLTSTRGRRLTRSG